jgi:hypothetical protein
VRSVYAGWLGVLSPAVRLLHACFAALHELVGVCRYSAHHQQCRCTGLQDYFCWPLAGLICRTGRGLSVP